MRHLRLILVGMLFVAACKQAGESDFPERVVPASTDEPRLALWNARSDSFTTTPYLLQIDSVSTAYAADVREADPLHSAEIVQAGSVDLTPAELISVYQSCGQAADRPTALSQLDGGYRMFQSSLTENQAASLGILGIASITGRREALVIRYNFYRYTTRTCTLNRVQIPVVWGVGVASTLHIKQLSRGARTNQLTGIAASVEFNHASVDMTLDVPGLTGAPIEAAYPSAGSVFKFDVESYGTLVVAIDKIRTLISAQGVTVTPQLLVTDQSISAIRVALRGPTS